MSELVDAWRAGVAKMCAAAIESVDAPLEEDAEGICVEGCSGPLDDRCVCRGNVAEPGAW